MVPNEATLEHGRSPTPLRHPNSFPGRWQMIQFQDHQLSQHISREICWDSELKPSTWSTNQPTNQPTN